MVHEKNNAEEGVTLGELILQTRELFFHLVSKWRLLLFGFIVGAILGGVFVWKKESVYIGKCTFVLSEEGLASSAGIASLIGLGGANTGSNGLFKGENLYALYQSRLMLQKTLLSEVTRDNKRELLVDRYIKINKLREKWNESAVLNDLTFSGTDLTTVHDSVLGGIVNAIRNSSLKVGRDAETSLISIEFRSKDQLFAKAFTDILVENVSAFYVQTQTKRSLQNLKLLQKQADSIRRILDASITGVASSIDANPNPNHALQLLRVPSQKRQIDLQTNTAIYSEVVKNLEITRMAMRKETPLIQIVDRPILPLTKERPKKVLWVVVGGILSSFLITVYLVAKMLIKKVLSHGSI